MQDQNLPLPPDPEQEKRKQFKKTLKKSAWIVMIIDIILGLFIFHFNCSQILASLLVYAILSVLLFPVVLWVVSMFRPEYFESGLFSAASGFIHMTKSFFFPIVGGLLAMIISEKVSPTRVEVKIAITDFEPEPVANVTAQYEADYIMPAVRNLGDFGKSFP